MVIVKKTALERRCKKTKLRDQRKETLFVIAIIFTHFVLHIWIQVLKEIRLYMSF